MKPIKKMLAFLLILCMVLGSVATVYAAETDPSMESAAEVQTEDGTGDADEASNDATDVAGEEGAAAQAASTDTPMLTAGSEETELAAVSMASVTKNQSVPLDTSTFYRIFHLDAGRIYFSVSEIEAIIDQLAANHYTHMELAVGNDALRFLLDDMEVSANNTTYSDDAVTNGIITGNNNYHNDSDGNYLTESEMNSIISYANTKGISIIPLINTPGHMDSIIDCMKAVGISNPAYSGSVRTVDVTNAEAVNFTLALIEKYIKYFANKGCTIFNMGCDEYANDVYSSGSMGFGNLISTGKYGNFITYVNNMAAQVQNAGMTAMAFNDGIYFNDNKSSGTIDTNIAVAYWSTGWGTYSLRSAANLVSDGFKIINTNDAWYYVMGRSSSGDYNYSSAISKVASTKVTSVPGSSSVTPTGCMSCVWCDDKPSYTSAEVSNVNNLISTLASSNPDYFISPEEQPVTKTDTDTGITVTGKGLTGLKVVWNETPSYSEEGKLVVGYDITPEDASGTYEGNAVVTIPVPSGWNGAVSVYDVDQKKILDSTTANNTVTFTATHFSEYDLVTDDQTKQSVSVSVDGTTTVTVPDANYAGDYSTADSSIATVIVTGEDAHEGSISYEGPTSVEASALGVSSSSYTKTNYYYKVGDNYYPVYARKYISYAYYIGYSTTDSSDNVTQIANGQYDNFYPAERVSLYTQLDQEKVDAFTNITFAGHAIGTTTVVIGGVTYTINVTEAVDLDCNYVVDFGLPVSLSLEDDLGIKNTANIENVVTTSNVSYDSSSQMITYNPTGVLQGIDRVTVQISFISGDIQDIDIGFVPATTVYYEEGYADLAGFDGGSKGTDTQTTSAVKSEKASDPAVYGYDTKYALESAGPSNRSQATSTTKGDEAVFAFTGTGIDIYANTTESTGNLIIQIVNSAGQLKKFATVQTAMKKGDTTATERQGVSGYNVPIYSITGLDRDAYTVYITHSDANTVNLDGFRVYGTLADNTEAYVNDQEDNPGYIELRNGALSCYQADTTGQTTQIYSSDSATDASITEVAIINDNSSTLTSDKVADLLTNGPKNEIYLQPKQTLVFKVSTNRQVEIGLKALNAETSYAVNNGDAQKINSSTDMFYTISKGLTKIKNNSDSILAITKLKICDDPSATLVPLTEEDIAAAVEVAEEEPQPVYADANLTVEVNGATSILTKNGIEGEAVTFKASEIRKAAEELVADGYELKGSFKDVKTTYGSSETVSFTATQKVKYNPVKNFFNNIFNQLKNLFGRRR